MRNQHGDFIWYELVTTDLNGAQAFYEAVLGWAIRDSGVPDMDYRLAATATQDIAGLMALPAEALEAGARPVWLGYVAVDDVDAAVAKIVAEGGSVQMPAMDMPGVGRFAMVMDPDGLPFYVMRGALNDTSHAFSGSAIGHCSWNELSAKSLTGAEKFYTPQFGWHFADGMDMGEMGMYKFIQLGEKGIGGAMQAHEMAGPPLWNFYFRVADIDKAAATIQAQGGKILHGPSEVPGNDFIINGLDPQGVLFSLVGARQAAGTE
ncbi:MAG: VOC family protein [Pseudomonadales bacterium]|nr:VOC family protein [Pseudomonadales bacterium]MCP5343120.1 VOC family protein [Pseudomonadales bacterium]